MPPQPAGQGQSDNSLGLLWILIAVFVVLLGIWYFASDYIVYAVLKIKYYELVPIQLFTDKVTPLMQWIAQTPPDQVTFNQFLQVLTDAGSYYSWPFTIILLIFAFLIFRANPARSFKRVYSMETLAKAEAANWPMIGPVTKMNLIDKDLNEGPWAMAMTPLDFGKKYGLLRLVDIPLEAGRLSRERKQKLEVQEGEANKVFALQLSRPLISIQEMPIYARALFAIFAARGNRDRDNADKILQQIAISSKSGHLNFAGVDELIKKHLDSKIVKRLLANHAYLLPFMAAMLEFARTDGVLATAEFLWLKPVDRRLWYMLNNVGRQTAFTEVAGPVAHFLAEKELGRKIIAPMIQEATKALMLAIEEIAYSEELHGEFSPDRSVE